EPADTLTRLVTEAITQRTTGAGVSPWDLPIVAACRRLLADTIGQLPILDTKGRQPSPSQPSVFIKPDPSEPRWLSMYRIVDNLTGYGYVWLVPTAWDAANYPVAIRIVDAPAAAGTFTETGELAEITYLGRHLTPGMDGAIWLPFDVPHRA